MMMMMMMIIIIIIIIIITRHVMYSLLLLLLLSLSLSLSLLLLCDARHLSAGARAGLLAALQTVRPGGGQRTNMYVCTMYSMYPLSIYLYVHIITVMKSVYIIVSVSRSADGQVCEPLPGRGADR